jgi:uncharacterized membrane-anchored protein
MEYIHSLLRRHVTAFKSAATTAAAAAAAIIMLLLVTRTAVFHRLLFKSEWTLCCAGGRILIP